MNSEKIKEYKFYFAHVANELCPGFQFVPQNMQVINDIFRYCLCMSGKLNTNKGLWIYGDIGTGKTTMLQIVKKFCSDVRGIGSDGFPLGTFKINNTKEVCGRYEAKGIAGIQEYIDSNKLAFDEIGSESDLTGYYGNQLNVMQYILQRRYDKRAWSVTHCTTNMDIQEIAEKYGDRIYDRAKEMFNFVEMPGKTFRKI